MIVSRSLRDDISDLAEGDAPVDGGRTRQRRIRMSRARSLNPKQTFRWVRSRRSAMLPLLPVNVS